jgi:hypothetical protein
MAWVGGKASKPKKAQSKKPSARLNPVDVAVQLAPHQSNPLVSNEQLLIKLEEMSKGLAEARACAERFKQLYYAALKEAEDLRRGIMRGRSERHEDNSSQQTISAVMQSLGLEPKGTKQTEQSEPIETIPPAPPAKKKSFPHGRRKPQTDLPRIAIELLPEEVKALGTNCFTKIGEEVTTVIERVPSRFIQIEYTRPKFVYHGQPANDTVAAPNCANNQSPLDVDIQRSVLAWKTVGQLIPMASIDESVYEKPQLNQIYTAAAIQLPIDRCLVGASVLANIITNKFVYHLPLNRQQHLYASDGFRLQSNVMVEYVAKSAQLLSPIVNAMLELGRRTSPWIGIDATGLPVREKDLKDKCHYGHIWTMVMANEFVVFRYTKNHTHEEPLRFLQDYLGYTQADAHSVYEELYRRGKTIEVGCWAHCRRYFIKARDSAPKQANAALTLIGQLFHAEQQWKKLPADQRVRNRQEKSAAIVEMLEKWIDEEAPKTDERSAIRAAMTYATNQRIALRRFLEDGRLRLDNNLSENALRRIAIGRKNYMFAGNETSAHNAAILYSLVATCKMRGLNVESYLREVLAVVGDYPTKKVIDLAPMNWLETRQGLIADGKLRFVEL